MYCNNCGTQSNDKMQYCFKCGALLQDGAEQSSTQAPRYQAFSNVSMNETAQAEVKYAGFWIRFAAYLLDAVFIYIAFFVLGLIFGVSAFASGDDETAAGLLVVLYFVIILGVLFYKAIMEASPKQGTLGKMIVGIKVTDVNGNRISFGRSIGRYFSMILSGLILYVGFMMAGWTAKKQALHDMIAEIGRAHV